MQELNPWDREWYGQTTLHPLGLTAVVVLGLVLLFVPRRFAILPMFVLACFVPLAQRLVVFTLDFDLLRLIVLFGWTRVSVRQEYKGFVWKPIDTAFSLWLFFGTVLNVVLFGTEALVNRLGWLYDGAGMYFLCRCLVRDLDDVERFTRGVVLVSIPVAFAFIVEQLTARNAFSVFGGVPEITHERGGRLRCQGAYSHPILAGVFWASLMPLIAAQWWKGGRGRTFALAGLATSSLIVVTCASATPVMGALSAALGGGMFLVRRYMGWVRWGLVAVLFALHMVMKQPVWHLISRIDIVGGSTGYHRYKLINEAINHFGEWWLIGSTTTATWGVTDITNQYVFEGLRAGLPTLLCFLAVVTYAFKGVGRMWRAQGGDPARTALAWALGVSLFVHVMSFFAVSYFGQINLIWFLLLATIASLMPLRRAAVNQPQTFLAPARVAVPARFAQGRLGPRPLGAASGPESGVAR